MKATTILLPGVLLASGLFINCSSDSGTTSPVFPAAGAAGAVSSAGAPGAGAAGASGAAPASGGGGASAGTGGMSTAGAAGAVTGTPPGANNKCVPGALLHTEDMLCYCQPTTFNYCTDGCFDAQSDADHCGSCTTKCGATQVCDAGKCGGTPSTFVPAQTGCGPIHLALAGTTLYWTETMSGKVKSIATAAGSTLKTISSTEKSPAQIVANATAAYWIDGDTTNKVMKSVGGATPTAAYTATAAYTQSDQAGAINGITLDAAGNLYVAEFKTIYKVPAAGGAAVKVGHEDSGVPHALSVDDTLHLIGYPTAVNGDVDIMTMGGTDSAVCASADSTTATNANCIRVGRSQGSLNFDTMLVSGGKAYWGNQAQVQSASSTDAAGTNTTIASGDGSASNLPALAFTGGNTTFFVDDVGVVSTSPLTASATAKLLARGQMGSTSIAADATNAYWAAADCSIQSVPYK